MITGVALLIGVLATATVGHRPLRRLLNANVDARIVLCCWVLTIGSVIATSVVVIAVLALPDHGGVQQLLHKIGRCWSDLWHGSFPRLEQGAAGLVTLIFLLLGARLVRGAVELRRDRRRRREDVTFALAVSAPAGSASVHWLDHTQPVAFSVPGRPGVVAMSRNLQHRLSARALAATLEHEHAHLRGRHHLIVDLVDAAGAWLTKVGLFRHGRTDVRELVEMAADNAAVRRYGTASVAEALRVMTAHGPAGALAMADTAVARRLRRLEGDTPPKLARTSYLWCVAATAAVPMLPTAAGVALLALAGCV